MALQIGQREVHNVTILDLDGALILGEEVSSFRDRIDTLIAQGRANILANLGQVRMIDSSGLGVLVSAHLAIEKAGGAIKLLNASQKHINLLVLTKLSTMFPNFEDEEAGVRSFLPADQAGKHFDILEFVRSEEAEGESLTGEKSDGEKT